MLQRTVIRTVNYSQDTTINEQSQNLFSGTGR